MKRVLILCIFVLVSFGVGAGPLDFVVLLDISESMLPYFDDTVNYLIGDLLKQHLAASDGFHLLTFANYPEIELTLEIEGQGEVNEALDRVLLLQPLGQYTDLVTALKFVYSYTSSVRQDSTKKILVLTDGIHDPPPGTPYTLSESVYKDVAAEVAEDIRRKGWDITLVQFPRGASVDAGVDDKAARGMPGAGAEAGMSASAEGDTTAESDTDMSAGGVDLYTDLSGNLDVDVLAFDGSGNADTHLALGAPELVFPEELGRVGYSFTLPFIVRNSSDERILVELTELVWNGVDILDGNVSVAVSPGKSSKLRAKVRIPSSVELGPLTMELTAGFADDLRIYPRTGSVSLTLKGIRPQGEKRSMNPLPVLGYSALGLGGIILLTFIVFAVRGLVVRTFASTGVPVHRGSRGPVRERAIEMYVEGQNPNIGTRNVNYIRNNGSATVGGGFSTFLIYIYKLPSRIGLISRKGETYAFKQLKPDSFENTSTTVSECLGKEIVVLTENGRKVVIKFRRYVSKLERINRIMRLVDDSRESLE